MYCTLSPFITDHLFCFALYSFESRTIPLRILVPYPQSIYIN